MPVRRLRHRSTQGLVLDRAPRMVYLSRRRLLLSCSHNNHLIQASFVRHESSASNPDATVIPAQHRVTQQILSHWQTFRDLKLMFAGSRRAE